MWKHGRWYSSMCVLVKPHMRDQVRGEEVEDETTAWNWREHINCATRILSRRLSFVSRLKLFTWDNLSDMSNLRFSPRNSGPTMSICLKFCSYTRPLPLNPQRRNNPRTLPTLLPLLLTIITTIHPDFPRVVRMAIEPRRMEIRHKNLTMRRGFEFIPAVPEVIVRSLDQLIAPARPPTGAEVGGVRADPDLRAAARTGANSRAEVLRRSWAVARVWEVVGSRRWTSGRWSEGRRGFHVPSGWRMVGEELVTFIRRRYLI
ncbi:hypothetical protein KC336_g72 [Hortaea werneckii]|nr:hypothetical protein KC336_g72 [Hortaea werneckii]